jgi:hypothetical protein
VQFIDVSHLNFGIAAGSPARDAGVSLPGYNDGEPGGPDIGPFPVGEDPGTAWPRPRTTVFTPDPPERWNGPLPPEPDDEGYEPVDAGDAGTVETQDAADTGIDEAGPTDWTDGDPQDDGAHGARNGGCGCRMTG